MNITPVEGRGDVSPYELFYGKKPCTDRMIPFGARVYEFIPNAKRKAIADVDQNDVTILSEALWVPTCSEDIVSLNNKQHH